jgi:hypothetical protein
VLGHLRPHPATVPVLVLAAPCGPCL